MYARPDGDNLNSAVDAPQQRRLQIGEAERRDDELSLVRQAVRDVVKRGEEREQPCLRIQESFVEST